MRRVVTALDLLPGDRVQDDFTEWAEVVAVGHVAAGVRVAWRLADGKREATTYRPEDRFTLLGSAKFYESGLTPVDEPRPTCEGMGEPY